MEYSTLGIRTIRSAYWWLVFAFVVLVQASALAVRSRPQWWWVAGLVAFVPFLVAVVMLRRLGELETTCQSPTPHMRRLFRNALRVGFSGYLALIVLQLL